jgi:hypothetical protein
MMLGHTPLLSSIYIYIKKIKESNGPGQLPLSDDVAVSSPHASRSNAGNKLDPEWVLQDDWRQWFKGKFQFSDADVDKLAGDFRDYWTSSGRTKPPKREWFPIWQEWSFFEAFWTAFPPGRKQGKPTARQTFLSIINGSHKVQGRAPPERLVEAAKRYAATKPDPKYTPKPTTWLNDGRWEDEDSAQRQSQKTANEPIELDGDGDLLGGAR